MLIQLSSGKGPAECEQAVMLFWENYLLPFIKKERGSFEIVESTKGTHSGCLKSLIVSVKGSEDLLRELFCQTGTIQ